jgi:uncharacterized protein GlcG (DUF336 family)
MLPNSLILSSRPLLLGLLAVVVASGVARGQASSGVSDAAAMFSEDAVRKAKTELSRIERAHGVPVMVETVASLKGETIDDALARRVERLGHAGQAGIIVLIAKQEHKVEVQATPRALLEEVGRSRLHEIRDVFTDEFRDRRVDEGLIKGIQMAEKVLATVRTGRTLPPPNRGGFLPSTTSEGSSSGGSPLVLRQQVRLTLAGARKAIEGAEAKATKEGWKMNIAVVDDGGHLLAFGRMDGARPASVATSMTKAVSAATFRQVTGPVMGSSSNGVTDVLLNLSVQNASGGKITTLLGGVPIVVDGQVIGAIGVGGGSGEQDLETAKAGLNAFLEGLQAKPEEPRPKAEEEAKPKEAEPKPAKPAEPDTTPKP